jgi:hypothetical protein
MTDRTVLLLDVDGVLSPFLAEPPDYFTDWQEPENFGFHAPLSKQMADRITSWGVEIVWLTTWEGLANELIAPIFGWDEKETIFRTREDWDGDFGWWKASAAKQWLKDNPVDLLLWFDDDLSEHRRSVANLPIPEDKRLLLSPDRGPGLTPDDLDRVEKWLAEKRGV